MFFPWEGCEGGCEGGSTSLSNPSLLFSLLPVAYLTTSTRQYRAGDKLSYSTVQSGYFKSEPQHSGAPLELVYAAKDESGSYESYVHFARLGDEARTVQPCANVVDGRM